MVTANPWPPAIADSTRAIASPPSAQSCALASTSAARGLDEQRVQRTLLREIERRRPPGDDAQHDLGELRAAELREGLPQQVDREPGRGKPDGTRRRWSSSRPSMPITGVGQIAESPDSL